MVDYKPGDKVIFKEGNILCVITRTDYPNNNYPIQVYYYRNGDKLTGICSLDEIRPLTKLEEML